MLVSLRPPTELVGFGLLLQGLRVLFVCCCCLFAGVAQSAEAPVVLDMAVLQQRDGVVDDIASVAAAGIDHFESVPHSFSGGYTRQSQWFRFTLNAAPGEWWLSLLPPQLDSLQLFTADPAQPGAYLERHAGDHFAFQDREVNDRSFVFKLHKQHSEPMVFFLRMQTSSSSRLVARVSTPAAFYAASTLEYGILMGVIGVLTGVLLVGINSWLWLRDELSFWFALYLLGLLVSFASLDGFLTQYFFQTSPVIGDSLVSVTSLISTSFAMAFYRRLFLIQPQPRLMFNIFRLATWLPLLALPLIATGYVFEAMASLVSMVLLMIPICTWMSFRLWQRRNPGGRTLLLANLISIAGAASTYLMLLGGVPASQYLLYGLQISSLGTAFALHIVVGARLSALRHETLAAQSQMRHEHQVLQQQTEFFSMLSHELKTPLAMIDGSVQSLQILTPNEPDIDRRHDRIRRAVGRINDLLQRFLINSHLDNPEPTLQKRQLEFGALVRNTVARFALTQGRFVMDLEPQCTLLGDEELLDVLVSNLIDNADKYSPAGEVIRVTLRRSAALAVLEVSDHGPGVAPDIRNRLFDAYARSKFCGDTPGAGLGLYLVRKIARLHGGEVQLRESPPDQVSTGATFRVSLSLTESQI
jgi:signal transduction histidine kinase